MRRALWLLLLVGQADPAALMRVQDHGKASLWVAQPSSEKAQALTVKLSETLKVVMRIEGEAPLDVELTQKVRSSEGWQLAAAGAPSQTQGTSDGMVRWEQVIKATPLQPGKHPLQLPALQFSEKEGAERKVSWAPLAVEIVTRVAQVDIGEARDLSGIEELPPPPSAPQTWWPWLLAVLPLAAGAAFVVFMRRQRVVQEKSPRELALAELEEAARLSQFDGQRLQAHLAEILRTYLERVFDLPATRQTTPEFFEALSTQHAASAAYQPLLRYILAQCDLAKFAGIVPSAEQCQHVVHSIRDFVEQSGPDDQPRQLGSTVEARENSK